MCPFELGTDNVKCFVWRIVFMPQIANRRETDECVRRPTTGVPGRKITFIGNS